MEILVSPIEQKPSDDNLQLLQGINVMIGATTHEIQTNTEVRLSATVPNALILSCPKASSGLKPLRIELMRCNDNLHGICSSRDLGIEISLSAVEKEDQEVKMLILPFVEQQELAAR